MINIICWRNDSVGVRLEVMSYAIFAVDEYLEYALDHNMDVLFTETTFTSAIESIYKFVQHGYRLMFKEVEQVAPGGIVLNPKIHILLWRKENETVDR